MVEPLYHYVSLLLLAEVVMDMHATVLRNNTAGGAGGAVSLSSEARLYASDCLFEGNTVYNNATGDDSGAGGALYADRMASVALVNITLVNNQAGYGGAMRAASNSSINLTNSMNVSGNQAVYTGGAIYLAEFATVSLSHDVLVKNNSAGSAGGGIAALANSSLVLGPGVQVVNNTAEDPEGDIYTEWGSNLTINSKPGATSRVSVSGNVAKNRGGGVCLYSDVFAKHDGTWSGLPPPSIPHRMAQTIMSQQQTCRF